MGYSLAQKIINKHITSGKTIVGNDIGLKIDQTLTQDATGTMAYLELEAMNIKKVKTELSVAYIDHNMLQTGFENADDHRFIQSVAKKRGIYFSRPGNGICHQVHLERFAIPGKTLIGSDSHTPTAGGIGMLAMGAGGLDVAAAMGGGSYHINMPKIMFVNLKGQLKNMVSAKDIILTLLKRLSVKGGVGKIIEYGGEGIKSLSVPERATITNMGAELGATTSIFPSDEITKQFLKAQGRDDKWIELLPDEDAFYDEIIEIDLSSLQPMAACPHSPDNVKPVKELQGMKVDQVCIGSCTNSSYEDLMSVALILKGKTINENVSLSIAPGSKQVYNMLAKNGALSFLIDAGARILESSCGPCIGMGQSPSTDAVSLRTFNRNFYGRSGTKSAGVYLVSPQTAAISALNGVITDPMKITDDIKVNKIDKFVINDNMIITPADEKEAENIKILKGPNIKSFPKSNKLQNNITAKAILKVSDNITTDHIMPAGSKILPFRSNIPYLSKFCFSVCDENFYKRCQNEGSGIIIGGENYGQGSSREHAALVPLYLGIKVVIVKSFARIHLANLINAGILPLTFKNKNDFNNIEQMDKLCIINVLDSLKKDTDIQVKNITKNETYLTNASLSEYQKEVILAGGLLNYIKNLNN